MTQEAVFSKDGIKGWILAVMQESAPFCTRYSFCIRNSHPSRSAPDTNPCLVPNPMHSSLFSASHAQSVCMEGSRIPTDSGPSSNPMHFPSIPNIYWIDKGHQVKEGIR